VPILVRTAAPHPSAVGVVLLVRAPGDTCGYLMAPGIMSGLVLGSFTVFLRYQAPIIPICSGYDIKAPIISRLTLWLCQQFAIENGH